MRNIDLYYESLRQVYDQIEEWRMRRPTFIERVVDWLVGVSAILLIVSVIPVFPAILVFIGRQTGLVIGPLNLRVAGFGRFIVVWIVTAVCTVVILGFMLWINGRVDSRAREAHEPAQRLSAEQLTFIAIYESHKELKLFFVSHVEQHITNALEAFKRLVPSRILWKHSSSSSSIVRDRYGDESLEEELVRREVYLQDHRRLSEGKPALALQVSLARRFLNTFDNYPWFVLDATTKSVLQALVSFPGEVYYRLLEKEDLAKVLSILDSFTEFVYAFLPEHATYMEPEALQRLQSDGRKALDSFVQEIDDLAPYRPVVEKEKRPAPELSPSGLRQRITGIYAGNTFVRFAIWFIVILFLTSGLVYSIDQRLASLDANVMVTMVVGGSATGAATLAAVTPNARPGERRQRSGDGSGENRSAQH